MISELKKAMYRLYQKKKAYQTQKTSSQWITPQLEESPQFITDGRG